MKRRNWYVWNLYSRDRWGFSGTNYNIVYTYLRTDVHKYVSYDYALAHDFLFQMKYYYFHFYVSAINIEMLETNPYWTLIIFIDIFEKHHCKTITSLLYSDLVLFKVLPVSVAVHFQSTIIHVKYFRWWHYSIPKDPRSLKFRNVKYSIYYFIWSIN